jgi:hypothetical protein
LKYTTKSIECGKKRVDSVSISKLKIKDHDGISEGDLSYHLDKLVVNANKEEVFEIETKD